MVHVAKEMTREGFDVPLLIGGATTSKAHTAVKIAPSYAPGVVHVLDASRAVGVVGSLVSPNAEEGFVQQVRDDYTRMRQAHQDRGSQAASFDRPGARQSVHVRLGGRGYSRADGVLGMRTIADQPLVELIPYIDWSPFFHTWELKRSLSRRSLTTNCRP